MKNDYGATPGDQWNDYPDATFAPPGGASPIAYIVEYEPTYNCPAGWTQRAGPVVVSVFGNSNIFGAGHPTPPAPAGGGAGVLPTQVPIPITTGAQIEFPTVTGVVNEGSGPNNPWNGPDGWAGASSYNSVGGIAGLQMPVRMPLVGVFLDDSEPTDPAPSRLDFNGNLNFTSLSPALRQVFFIGDGKTDQGTLQVFNAPTGATRLFVGIADASSHLGDVGFYGDNQGAFAVTVQEVGASPTPRENPPNGLAFDSARGRIVLFGGSPDAGGTALDDTWEWDGNSWSLRTPAHHPLRRVNHTMVYDSARGVCVFFGGSDARNSILNDTWEWDGTDWTQRFPSHSPPPRFGHGSAYDSVRHRVVIYGGDTFFGLARDGGQLNDTWEWDGNDWVQMNAVGPSPRYFPGMAFDQAAGKVVLFGGLESNAVGEKGDTWLWDGNTWTLASTTGPQPRHGHGLAYDSQRGKTVLFGGSDNSGFLPDTWEWNGATWMQRSGAGPSARYNQGMAYDSIRHRIVMFGGIFQVTPFGDTWELGGIDSPSVTSQPASQSVSVGATASFGVVAIGSSTLSYQWRKGGNDLSDGGNISGATTATLTINPVGQSDAGNYDCVVSNICGSATSDVAALDIDDPCPLAFSPAVAYGPGDYLLGVAIGDLNGDGKPDLAAANWGSSTVSVLLGNGNGTFQPAVHYAVQSSTPDFVAIGDFNGDGKQDLAVANANSANISVLLGNGDGTFQLAIVTPVGVTVYGFSVGDLNHDGRLDIVVPNGAPPTGGVEVLLGRGDGTFDPPVHYAADVGTAGAVGIGDFNGDGKLDLATANYASSNVSTLLGNGDGTFQAPINSVSAFASGTAFVGDFDQDGIPDLAAGTNLGFTVLRGHGDGTFEPIGGNYVAGNLPQSMTLGDLNGDGFLDVAIANFYSNDVSVFLGRGNGTFRPAVGFGAFGGNESVAIGDLNDDGRQDLALAAWSGNVSVLLNANHGPNITVHPASQSICLGGSVTLSVSAIGSDLTYQWRMNGTNIDGATSAMLHIHPVSTGEAGSYDVLVSDGCGSVTSNPATLLVIGSNSADCNNNATPDSCDIASGQSQDCNANGIPDSCELTTATDCNNNAILDTCESAPIALGQPANYPAGDYPSAIIAADLDNDGALDLATADYNANTIAILKSTPTGLFNPPTTQPTGHAPFALAAADIDADNKIDLITANESAGTVSVLRNLGGGAFAPHVDYTTAPGCFSVAIGDLNGDNKPDIATANEAANSVSILINAGGGGFGSASNIPVAGSPQFVAIADLDGDGDRDLVVVNTGPDKISILLNTGLGLFAAPVLYSTGEDPTSVAIADLDGDGRLDLAVTNLSGNSLSIFRNVGAGAFALAATIPAGGVAPDQVVARDVNGDTYPDLIVSNSSSNTLTIHLNTGIGTFRAPVSVNVGARPLGVVAAALHGGGILDIAVANASDDSVSILRNYTTAPPPADCNLDGTPDTCQTPEFHLASNLCASFSISQPALLGFTDDGPAANSACAANRNFRLFAGRADAGANKIWRIRKDCTQAAFGSVLAGPSSVLIDAHGYYAGGCTSPNNILVGGRSGSDDIISVLNNTTGAVCEQLIDNTIHGIGQMALAPDGRLYIGSTDGDCLMLFSKGVVSPLFCYPGRALRAVALSPNGNVYVAGAIDGILRVLTPDGVVLNSNFAGCLQGVTSLAFAAPGVFHGNLYAACAAPANRVLEIDLATGQTRPFLSNIAVGGIAFDPEGYMHLSIPGENRILKLGARHPGDMNGDSTVNVQDIPGFIAAALLLPSAPLPVATADMNGDGCVNGKDIQLLVAALSGP